MRISTGIFSLMHSQYIGCNTLSALLISSLPIVMLIAVDAITKMSQQVLPFDTM
jgi:hypothetical protein